MANLVTVTLEIDKAKLAFEMTRGSGPDFISREIVRALVIEPMNPRQRDAMLARFGVKIIGSKND